MPTLPLITEGLYASGPSVGPVVCAAVGPWTTPQDSKDLHFGGIVVSGRHFLCDQELAKILVDEAPERVIELEEFGHLWDRDADGNIAPYPEFSEEIRLPEESIASLLPEPVYLQHQGRYVLWLYCHLPRFLLPWPLSRHI